MGLLVLWVYVRCCGVLDACGTAGAVVQVVRVDCWYCDVVDTCGATGAVGAC